MVSKAVFDAQIGTLTASIERLNERLGKMDKANEDKAEDQGGQAGGPTAMTPAERDAFKRSSYDYLDDETFDAALAGTLPVEKLPFLMSPYCHLNQAASSDGVDRSFTYNEYTEKFTAVAPTYTYHQVIQRLNNRLPDVLTFLYAWNNLIKLMMHGQPHRAVEIFTALNKHSQWMLELSPRFTWESVIKYHHTIYQERFAGGFRAEEWTNPKSTAAIFDLVNLHDMAPPRSPSPVSTAGPSNKRRRGLSNPRPPNEICNRYNNGFCPLARCYRSHTCLNCGGDHPARDCDNQSSQQ